LKGTLSWGNAVFIGLLLSVLGQLGDLSASLMKRTAGVKDSGQVIPGHGGFIDRCDSLIFSTPVLYYYLELTGHF
jgi:phosphatidate cytidylyltransferase